MFADRVDFSWVESLVEEMFGIRVDSQSAVRIAGAYGSHRDTEFLPTIFNVFDPLPENVNHVVLKRHILDEPRLDYQTRVAHFLSFHIPVPRPFQRKIIIGGDPFPVFYGKSLQPLGLWTLTPFTSSGVVVAREAASPSQHRALGEMAARIQNAFTQHMGADHFRHVHTYKSRSQIVRELGAHVTEEFFPDAHQ